MPGLVRKSLDAPDEARPFEGGTGQLEVVLSDGGAVGRATYLPGMEMVGARQADCQKTDRFQAAHTGYFVSGRMKVVTDDGEQMEYRPGRLCRHGTRARRVDHWRRTLCSD
jgi:hypothetical protein